MKAVIIGAGPVGCLLAVGLRQRDFDVVVYEKGDDPRRIFAARGHSFNLTLSGRGMAALDRDLVTAQYAWGKRLTHRVIHRDDGVVWRQPYGVLPAHHLLSISRRALHTSLITAADRAGACLRFRHDCVDVNPIRASAILDTGTGTYEDHGDLLAGCDGANSVVRQAMVRATGLRVSQVPSRYGYCELRIPASPGPGARGTAGVTAHGWDTPAGDGLHIWPRRQFLMIAQPELDGGLTATLFLALASNGHGEVSFERLHEYGDVERFVQEHCRDVAGVRLCPAERGRSVRPAPLKTVRCEAFHHNRTVLVGDAAHTMLPFYGQGINCSFEDVRVLLAKLDRARLAQDAPSAITEAVEEFTRDRRPQSDLMAVLSESNLQELAVQLADARVHARADIEHELARRHPEKFSTLYCGLAFSTRPYDDVVREHRIRQVTLDGLCQRFDPVTDAERILQAYVMNGDAPPVDAAGSGQLQLTAEQQTHLLNAVVARILQHEADVRAGTYPASYVHDSLDVTAYDAGRRLSAELSEIDVPISGARLESLLSEIFDRALPCGTVHPHPGFMAHVPSGGLLQGATGSFVASALNRFAGVWVAAPGLVTIESNVIRWFCSLLGYGDRSFGYLTTSGSLANMMGLMCACRRGDDHTWPRQTVYVSDQGHYSVRKAAALIGVGPSRIRTVQSRADLTMDVMSLAERIQTDRAQGFEPRVVVATAGTTNTGAIDDLPALAALCRREGLWLHVDGCFGGFFRITARGRAALEGIDQADSIAVDGHKSLFLPHGNSALLVKQCTHLAETFAIPDVAYLPGSPEDSDLPDFCGLGPELSREIRGLAAWLPIKLHGIAAFAQALDERLDLANRLARGLSLIPSIQVIDRHPRHLPVVVFRPNESNVAYGTGASRRLCERVCARGRAYLTTTVLPGDGLVLRACILNHRTSAETVDALLDDVTRALEMEG
jgi:glutamate/tyrosine decarboxylase-like PLP-dependent enzyme/2-polyprenyl-6-methoxyphenol hydroxylase-like FAD-dependent oxidoreductase